MLVSVVPEVLLPNSRIFSAAMNRAWRASASAALIWLVAGAAADGQTNPGGGYDGAVAIEALCREYAAAQRGMPADLMFNQCMEERHCRVSAGGSGYQCEAPGPLSWHGGGY